MAKRPMKQKSSIQPSSILGSIQSEVGAETSPLLEFLAHHSRLIIACIIIFILSIVGYWAYSAQAKKNLAAEESAFAQLLQDNRGETRIKAIQEYLQQSPGGTRRMALLSLAEAAVAAQDYDTAYATWETIGKEEDSLRNEAALGMSRALVQQGKNKEALEVIENALRGADTYYANVLQAEAAAVAELEGDYARAVRACEAIIQSSWQPQDMHVSPQKVSFWTQRLEAYKQLQAGAAQQNP